MRRGFRVLLSVLVVLILALVFWHPAVATPNTGLTPEARAELAEILGK